MRHRDFLSDESGLETIEYIVVAALVAMFLFGILATIFTTMQTKFRSVNSNL